LIGILTIDVKTIFRYCNPRYDFPPQEEILSLVGALAEENAMLHGDKCLFVCGSYTIGNLKYFYNN